MKGGGIIGCRYKRDSSYFDRIDSPEKAYWLGLLTADGYLNFSGGRYAFGLSLNHCESLLQRFKADLGYEGPLYYRERTSYFATDKKSHSCSLEIHDHRLVDNLLSKGVTPDKLVSRTYAAHAVPEKLKWHYMRGLVDGDGWITKKQVRETRYPNLVQTKFEVGLSGSEALVSEVKKQWNALRTKIRLRPTKRDGVYFAQFSVGGNIQIGPILDALYDNPTRYIEAKRSVYQDYKIFQSTRKRNGRAS